MSDTDDAEFRMVVDLQSVGTFLYIIMPLSLKDYITHHRSSCSCRCVASVAHVCRRMPLRLWVRFPGSH